MLPPWTAVDWGAAAVAEAAAVAGALPVGADVAGAGVALLEQAVAIRAANASKEPKRFTCTPFLVFADRG
jgi:hypothetical protein